MEMQPGKALTGEKFARWLQLRCSFKGPDVIVCLGRKANIGTGERRTAPRAEAALNPRRRIVFRNSALRYRDRVIFERNKDTCWRSAMPPAAFAVTPTHPIGFAGCLEAHCTAKAASRVDAAHGSLPLLPVMTAATTVPDKKVSAPMMAIAQAIPKKSAMMPADSAPMA